MNTQIPENRMLQLPYEMQSLIWKNVFNNVVETIYCNSHQILNNGHCFRCIDIYDFEIELARKLKDFTYTLKFNNIIYKTHTDFSGDKKMILI